MEYSSDQAEETLRRHIATAAAVACCLLFFAIPAEAEIVRGVVEIVSGVLTVPVSTLQGTFSGPPILGTVIGAVTGLVKGVGLVVHGAVDLAASAIAIGKAVGPYLIPVFL